MKNIIIISAALILTVGVANNIMAFFENEGPRDRSCNEKLFEERRDELHYALAAGKASWDDIRVEQTLYFPISEVEDGWETEICIINKSEMENMAGILKAFNGDGNENGSIALDLSPNARKEIMVSEWFTNSVSIDYLVFGSVTGTPCGYSKLSVDGKWRTAVPAANPNNSDTIYIPHIACNPNWWWTKVVLLNTGTEGKMIHLDFNTGDTWGRYLASGEQYQFTMRELFQGNPPDGLRSAVVGNADGIVGLELFGSTEKSGQDYLGGVLLKGETAHTIHFPHIVEGKVFWTGIVVNNPFDTTADVTVNPYTSDGTQLPPSYVRIEPRGHYFGTMTNLDLTTEAAWIEIDSATPLIGFELFGTHDKKRMAGYTGVNISTYEGIFPKLEKNGWTGISFVNLEDETATIRFTAYDDAGLLIADEALELEGLSKVVGIVENVIMSDLSRASYLAYSSNREVVAFQLNGCSDQMMLDGLQGL